MGYINAGEVSAGQYVPLGTQFENVAGGDIAVKDAVKVGNPVANAAKGNADQIWIWDTTSSTWTYYFYYQKPRSTDKYWVKEGVTGSETTDTIPAGTTFFFLRATTATGSTSLTLAGGVKDLTGSSSFSVTAGQLAFVSNPWPMPIVIKDFNNYITSGDAAANAAKGNADQIWLWDTPTSTWTYYFYYQKPRSTDKYWVKDGVTGSETTDTIPVGKGIFFQRATTASTTIPLVVTFKNK